MPSGIQSAVGRFTVVQVARHALRPKHAPPPYTSYELKIRRLDAVRTSKTIRSATHQILELRAHSGTSPITMKVGTADSADFLGCAEIREVWSRSEI